MNKRKAMTIVELIISMTLLSIVITTSLWLVLAMARGQKQSYNEYDLQNSVRVATMNLNNAINESSAIFTIQEGGLKFGSDSVPKNLTKEWDYYFVSKEGDAIIRYVYIEDKSGIGGSHKKEVVMPKQPGIRYKLSFSQPKDANGNILNNKFIGYKIEVYRVEDEKADETQWVSLDSYTIETQMEAKSAGQVVFRGTEYKPNVALAVRSLKGPIKNQKSVAFVTFVLDVSGSMNFALDGTTGKDAVGKKLRAEIMKEAAEFILKEYSKEDGVEVILIPFSFTANYPQPSVYVGTKDKGPNHPIYTKNKNALAAGKLGPTAIKGFDEADDEIRKLKIVGGTNVGDALRRVWHSINFINDEYVPRYYSNKSIKISHYLILLVDGVPTSYSLLSKVGNSRDTKYFRESGNYYSIEDKGGGTYGPIIDNQYYRHTPTTSGTKVNGYKIQYGGYESYLDLKKNISSKVVEYYGKEIIDKVDKTFVIGFSSKPEELAGVDYIARSCGIPDSAFPAQVIKYTDASTPDLSEVFLIIKQQIMNDLWLIRGPDI